MEFTYNEYKTLINTSLEKGYVFSDYVDVDNYEKVIILRHDIDLSPEKALKIAEIEYELGVKSIYFLLLSTNFYNVFSKETSKIISEIIDMGHNIGLHFDEQRYETNSIDQIKKHIYREKEILEIALDVKIEAVSMHIPSRRILDSFIELDKIVNSYSYKYFKEMKYLSDSLMNWRENPIEAIANNKYDKLHILTHPFWYSNKKESAKNKMEKFIEEAKIDRYNLLDQKLKEMMDDKGQGDLL